MKHAYKTRVYRCRVCIELRLNESAFCIDIGSLNGQNLMQVLTSSGSVELRKMGFDLSETMATKSWSNFVIDNIDELFQLLSRVFFDVFRLYGNREVLLEIE